MKKLLAGLLILVVAIFAGRFVTSVLAHSQDNEEHKVWVCHSTSSEVHPYNVVDVDEDAWNEHTSAHSGHKNDFLYGGNSGDPRKDEVWCENNVPSSLTCENPINLENYLDKIDLGDSTSEAAHNAGGWGADPGGGNYGGRDGGQNFSLVVGKNECNKGGKSASFTLNVGTNYANKITIRHLDGLSNLDSFDVFANGNLVGHYTDAQDSAEVWVTTEFPLPNLTGLINIEIKLKNNIWSGCETWGQLAINWVEIKGYECAGEQSPPPAVGGTSDISSAGPQQCTAQKPSTPGLLNLDRIDSSSVRLTWSPANPVTYYSISYGTDPNNFQYGVPNVGNVTTYVIGALNPNSTYYFSVRGVNDCNPSDPSNVLPPVGQVLGASTKVLGASTLGSTGSTEENLFLGVFTLGAIFLGMGVRKHAARASKRA